MKIVSKSDIFEVMDESQIPVEFGGSLKSGPLCQVDLNHCMPMTAFADKYNMSTSDLNKNQAKLKKILDDSY